MKQAWCICCLLVAACGSEPVRPMAPELDPASPSAEASPYTPPDNPLAGEVPDDEPAKPPAEPAPQHHRHPPDHEVPQ